MFPIGFEMLNPNPMSARTVTGKQLLENAKIKDGRQRDANSDIYLFLFHIELKFVLDMLFFCKEESLRDIILSIH